MTGAPESPHPPWLRRQLAASRRIVAVVAVVVLGELVWCGLGFRETGFVAIAILVAVVAGAVQALHVFLRWLSIPPGSGVPYESDPW